MGGDEFCVLVRRRRRAAPSASVVAARARSPSAARASRSAPRTAPSCCPTRHATPTRRARDRRPAHVRAEGRAARAQPATRASDVLLRALHEREPRPRRAHATASPSWRERSATRSASSPTRRARSRVRRPSCTTSASSAIPDAILNKPGPLDDDGVGVHAPPHDHRRAHPGRRAARCADVAKIVRASHERWDGDGYPDGLAGERHPARRAHHRRLRRVRRDDHRRAPTARRCAHDDALAELRRCAGTQFDPRVVEAFEHALTLRAGRRLESTAAA